MNLAACRPWLTTICPETAQTRLRLICASYAGGSSSGYRNWRNRLPAEIALFGIELPGRGARFAEPFVESMDSLLHDLVATIEPQLDSPVALFGHSLGAVIMFELASRLEQCQAALSLRLILSGQRALTRPPPRPPIHNLPDEEFLIEIQRYGGTPHGVFEDEELRDMFLPLLRADFRLGETYVYRHPKPLRCDLTVYGGLEDEEVSVDDIKAWEPFTDGKFTYRMFPGNHFFLQRYESLVLEHLLTDLSPY